MFSFQHLNSIREELFAFIFSFHQTAGTIAQNSTCSYQQVLSQVLACTRINSSVHRGINRPPPPTAQKQSPR